MEMQNVGKWVEKGKVNARGNKLEFSDQFTSFAIIFLSANK